MLELTYIRNQIILITSMIIIKDKESEILKKIEELEYKIERLKYGGISIYDDKIALEYLNKLINTPCSTSVYFALKDLRA